MAVTLNSPWYKRFLGLGTRRRKLSAPARSRPCLELLEDRTLPSVLTVTNLADHGEGSLRAAVAAARDGDTIRFLSTFDGGFNFFGVITLKRPIFINADIDIEGNGAPFLWISGNHAHRIFTIGPNASGVTIADVTLTNGKSNEGGAILDLGASLNLRGDTFSNDRVVGGPTGGTASGGALAILGESTSGAAVNVAHCRFINDTAFGGAAGLIFNSYGSFGGLAQGGAMFVDAGNSAAFSLTVAGSTFANDTAHGGKGLDADPTGTVSASSGGKAQGGAVWLNAANASMPFFEFTNDVFVKSAAVGGRGGNETLRVNGLRGGDGGEADGGALYYTAGLAAAPTLSVAGSSFNFNTARGAGGGIGGDAVKPAVGDGGDGGNGGDGGTADGGAVALDFHNSAAGSDLFSGDTFHLNNAIGGDGGRGGAGNNGGRGGVGMTASGGAVEITALDMATATNATITQSAILNNTAHAGNGGAGGGGVSHAGQGGSTNSSTGGGFALWGSAAFDSWKLNGDTIAFNEAIGGNGGAGGDATLTGGKGGGSAVALGGGFYDNFNGTLDFLHSTVVLNSAMSGLGGSGGAGSQSGLVNSAGIAGASIGGAGVIVATALASPDSLFTNNQADTAPDLSGTMNTI